MTHPTARPPARVGLCACVALAAAALAPACAGAASRKAEPAAPALAVRVQAGRLVDAAGSPLQLRGVNVSGLENTAAQGWNPGNPWGHAPPDFAVVRAWGANAVRIPLNESSWIGKPCVDGTGKQRNPDPGGNYREAVRRAVADANKAGLYVILDLHWVAPGNRCALEQQPMADADNAPLFWGQVAAEFKPNPAVVFELYNEPFMDWMGWPQRPWKVLREGGRQTRWNATAPGQWTQPLDWQSTGMQQLLDAVRATGAANVVLVAGLGWSRDLSGWLDAVPNDPLRQLGAVWHAYPADNDPAKAEHAIPLHGDEAYHWAEAILAAGYPVAITETGSRNTPGTRGAPMLERLLPWADKLGVSYLGWTFNRMDYPDHVLLKDDAGTPSDGYGQYFKAHLTCRAAGLASCP